MLAVFLALIVLAVSFCFVLGFFTECDQENRARARFTRFFTYFSNIETLVLGNLWNTQIFAAVNSALGNIPIARLEYRVPYAGPDTRLVALKVSKDGHSQKTNSQINRRSRHSKCEHYC